MLNFASHKTSFLQPIDVLFNFVSFFSSLFLKFTFDLFVTDPVITNEDIHLSIHFLPLNPSVGSRWGWSLSQQSSGERRGTPWTDRQSNEDI